jgi:NitT/TauT family transport system substrate-binding protein
LLEYRQGHAGRARGPGDLVTAMRHAVLGAIACILLATASASAQHKTVVKIGVTGRPDQAGFELALRRGYFAERGIEIETVQASAGQEFVAALASNQIQVTSGSPNAGLFNALNRGIDIRIVADFAHVGGAEDRTVAIMVRTDLMQSGAVKSLGDLKGRTVGFGPGRGQYPDVFYAQIFAAAKFTIADVTPVTLTFADSAAALSSGRLDAAFMVEPLVTQTERQKIAQILVVGGAVDPGAELSIVTYSPEFARQGDAPTRFMTAYLLGVRDFYDAFFLNRDRDAVIALLIRHLSLKDPTLWTDAMRRNTDLNGGLNVADLKRQAAVYKSQGTVTGPVPDLDRYVDTSFSEAAVRVIGKR